VLVEGSFQIEGGGKIGIQKRELTQIKDEKKNGTYAVSAKTVVSTKTSMGENTQKEAKRDGLHRIIRGEQDISGEDRYQQGQGEA